MGDEVKACFRAYTKPVPLAGTTPPPNRAVTTNPYLTNQPHLHNNTIKRKINSASSKLSSKTRHLIPESEPSTPVSETHESQELKVVDYTMMRRRCRKAGPRTMAQPGPFFPLFRRAPDLDALSAKV